LSSISIALSALWADFLFRTPPRSLPTARERRTLAGGERFDIPTSVGRLAAWRWPGEKPPVLLLHGWGGHAGRLSEFVEPLRGEGFGVVAFDAPAHGQSEGRRTTLIEFVTALQAVQSAVGPISGFIGHSVGATAGAIAIRGGLALRRAVLIAPPTVPEEYIVRFACAMGIPRPVREKMQEIVETRCGRPWRDLRLGAAGPARDVPLLIIHDLKDTKVPFRDRDAILNVWRKTKIIRTRGLGHHKILADRDVVRQAVSFLSRPSALRRLTA
jgi:pimeloyl-ACP methyl ester carboxylesterase